MSGWFEEKIDRYDCVMGNTAKAIRLSEDALVDSRPNPWSNLVQDEEFQEVVISLESLKAENKE